MGFIPGFRKEVFMESSVKLSAEGVYYEVF